MALNKSGGKLVQKNGALASGAGCCCGQCNPATCPTGTECQPPCVCVDGECVPEGGGGCNCSSPGSTPAAGSDTSRGLAWLEFFSCIGSGAAASVDAPRAASPCDYDGLSGPIVGVTLTNGGSGYARLGRVEPTVTATAGGGSGASFAVTLAQESEFLGDGCIEVPYWRVASVSVTSGGAGYAPVVPITLTAANGDTQVAAAKAYAYTAVEPPRNSTATFYGAGSGAAITPTWRVADGWAQTIEFPGARNPPFCGSSNRTAYSVTGFTIQNGGLGYSVGDEIEITFANANDGTVRFWGVFTVDGVDANGAITAIFVGDEGVYGGSLTDTIDSVVVESCINGGSGHYYREDASEPPYVSDVTVTVNQQQPSAGSGAAVTATVDADTSSDSFGEIISLTLVNGGSGYLSPPEACPLPEKLYFSWGDYNAEIPVFVAQGDVPAFGFVCPGPSASCRDRLWYRVDPDGDGVFCDWALQERNTDDIGNVGSRSYAVIEQGLVCRCGGKLHLTVRFVWQCFECVYVYKGDAINTDCSGSIVGLPGGHGLNWRMNFLRNSTLCLAFEMDELGCPVGDAIFVSQEVAERAAPETSLNPPVYSTPCAQYEDPETGHVYGGDPCPCDTGCSETPPGIPAVSLMPP